MNFPTVLFNSIIFISFPVLEARCSLDHCQQCTHGACTGCYPGWYGSDCSRRCLGCQTDRCEQSTGRCIQCSPGFYGNSCDIPCPVNCFETYRGATFCNRTTGHCLEGCRVSSWGSKCDKNCSPNCLQSACEQRNGWCFHGCNDDFYGVDCLSLCPKNCKKCTYLFGICENCKQGFLGSLCNKSCEHCKDEECKYNELDETLSCLNGCKDRWTSANCNARCSERCKDQLCEKDGKCMACPGGYVGADCTGKITTPQMTSGVEDLTTVGKYISHVSRGGCHRSNGHITYALIVMILLNYI